MTEQTPGEAAVLATLRANHFQVTPSIGGGWYIVRCSRCNADAWRVPRALITGPFDRALILELLNHAVGHGHDYQCDACGARNVLLVRCGCGCRRVLCPPCCVAAHPQHAEQTN